MATAGSTALNGCGASVGLLIRELSKTDCPALVFMFDHLSDASRYQRFLGTKQALSAPERQYLMDVDHWHREAVIAWSPPPRAPIGLARYVRCDEFDLAEIAITVVDAWQRRGVGRQLLVALRELALRAGIRRFTATMLRDNRGAIALTRRFGPTTTVLRSGGLLEVSGSWQAVPRIAREAGTSGHSLARCDRRFVRLAPAAP